MNFQELITLLKSSETVSELNNHKEEIAEIIPKVKVMFDYDQKNSAHQYDLWMHCLHTVVNLPRNMEDDMLYLAALLHDIGKPDTQVSGTREGDTNMHYFGHPKRSMEIARDEIIPYLLQNGVSLPAESLKRLLYYIEYHDDRVSLRMNHVRRHLKIATLEEFQNLMLLEAADAKAHVQIPIVAERLRICEILSGEYAQELCQRIEAGE